VTVAAASWDPATPDIATSRSGLRLLRMFFTFLVAFLYAPIAVLVLFSFNDSTTIAFPIERLTFRWYREFFANPELLASLRTSAVVAAISGALSVGMSLPAAIAIIRRRFLGKSLLSGLLLSPLVIPYIVFGIALLILFNSLQLPLSIFTIVIGHVVISMPYSMLVLFPRLEQVNVALEEASRDLGASSLETFRRVTLPLILPAVVSAFLVAFTLSFDEVVIASFVAGHQTTFPVYLLSQLRFPTRLPPVVALATVVMLASVVVVVSGEIGRRVVERRIAAQS
jgi:spermidine/putrescine transport system permease protein